MHLDKAIFYSHQIHCSKVRACKGISIVEFFLDNGKFVASALFYKEET
jgi:hypothetical protein